MDAVALVERYYDALDGHEYDTLEELLTPDFDQHRSDRRFESRDAFVRFMRDDRPNPDTRHELEEVIDDGDRIAVRGRVVGEGATLFEFVDFFELADGKIDRLETYSR